MLDEIKPLIEALRKKNNTKENWKQFQSIVENNLHQVCDSLDTRWLVSVCDTYVDYGNPLEQRNAMFVSLVANMEKIWATHLLMFDIWPNPKKLDALKADRIIPLWDGMYSFNINHGDMANYLFTRMEKLLEDTPALKQIFETVKKRMLENGTVLANLNQYHADLFGKPPRRSFLKSVTRSVRRRIRQYKLPVL